MKVGAYIQTQQPLNERRRADLFDPLTCLNQYQDSSGASHDHHYWGLTQPEYFEKADVWPLDPQGELLPMLQCETIESVNNLEAILDTAPKPGLILISESDLSVSLGH